MTGQVDYIPNPGCGSTIVKLLLSIILIVSISSLYLAGTYTYNYIEYDKYNKTYCYYNNGTIDRKEEYLTKTFDIEIFEYNTSDAYDINYPLSPVWINIKNSDDVNKTLEKIINSEKFSCILNNSSRTGALENYKLKTIIILYSIGLITFIFIIAFCTFRYFHLRGKIKPKNYKAYLDSGSLT